MFTLKYLQNINKHELTDEKVREDLYQQLNVFLENSDSEVNDNISEIVDDAQRSISYIDVLELDNRSDEVKNYLDILEEQIGMLIKHLKK